MRKLIKFLVITGVFVFVAFLIYGILKKADEKVISERSISALPRFSFITLSDSSFMSDSITEGPLLILRFHPECEHCQYEISEISKSNIPSSGVKLLLITSADRNSVMKFLGQFDFPDDETVIPLFDPDGTFYKYFGKDIVPSSYIYNKELKLVKALYGEYKVETIIKYLHEGAES